MILLEHPVWFSLSRLPARVHPLSAHQNPERKKHQPPDRFLFRFLPPTRPICIERVRR